MGRCWRGCCEGARGFGWGWGEVQVQVQVYGRVYAGARSGVLEWEIGRGWAGAEECDQDALDD